MEVGSKLFSRSQFHASNDEGETSDSDSNIPSRLPTTMIAVQSTVKVESRRENTIDRNKVCPLLMRIFYTYGRHHSPLDYRNKIYPKNELQVHTWMDATLSEILIHLQRKNRKVQRSGTIIKFQLVSPDPGVPRFKAREVGSIKINFRGPDDLKTLSQCRYTIGDFVDLCIQFPRN